MIWRLVVLIALLAAPPALAKPDLAQLSLECVAGRSHSCEKLAAIALRDGGYEVRLEAVQRLTDQGLLAKLARTAPDAFVRSAAAQKLRDQATLAEVARSDSDVAARWRSLEQLTDQTALAQIALTDPEPRVRQRAVEGLRHEASLAEVARKTNDPDLRQRALRCLWEMNSPLVARVLALPNVPFQVLSVDGESLAPGQAGVVVFAGLHGLSLSGAINAPLGFVAGPREVCTVVCESCAFPPPSQAGVQCAERTDAPGDRGSTTPTE